MNERIRELTERVGAGTPQSLYGRTDYIVMTEFELAKFAELIVRECSTLAFDGPNGILEHFGFGVER